MAVFTDRMRGHEGLFPPPAHPALLQLCPDVAAGRGPHPPARTRDASPPHSPGIAALLHPARAGRELSKLSLPHKKLDTRAEHDI